MEIKYEIHSIENSQGTGEKRVYVRLRNNPAMTTDELGKEVEQACSVTSSDLKAVMAELATIAVRELSQGNRFYLPEIGYLSLAVGNVPPSAKTDGKITGKDIYLRSINFRPEKKPFCVWYRDRSVLSSRITLRCLPITVPMNFGRGCRPTFLCIALLPAA